MFKLIREYFQEQERKRENAVLSALKEGELSAAELVKITKIGVRKIYPILVRLETSEKISSCWDWPHNLPSRPRRRLYRAI